MDKEILQKIYSNNHRILSRTISRIEFEEEVNDDFFIHLHEHDNDPLRIGITGPPGAGKSTITDGLIELYLEAGKSVGVVAIDPTSPFTGGALLGDRVRMNRFAWEKNVFIRSMGSQGELGGMARKAQDVGDILSASGKDIIIYETVGVGQGEHDVAKAVDLTVVVLVPESGDEIQLMKAGLIEIADLFIINKADRQGAEGLTHLLQNVLHSAPQNKKPEPPVLMTIANTGKGITELFKKMDSHLDILNSNGILHKKRLERHRNRVFGLIRDKLLQDFWTLERLNELENKTKTIDSVTVSPYEISNALLNHE